ncbi:MAG TPA: transglutaminaseTgpA domain-containing protein [Acidimicrobiales bacterium]|jgi:transglutaminase-like putative cysteine protease
MNPAAPVSAGTRMIPTTPSRTTADLLPDVVLLAVALATGLGAARLLRDPTSAHVLLPIAACIVTGHVVTSLGRVWRAPDPLPSVAGVLAVALMAVWTLLGGATRAGIPTATTIRVLLHRFSDAGTVIRSHPTPVPSTSGVVLCLAAGGGLAAVFAATLWNWQEARPPGTRRPLVALFPTFGLFCYTALLSSDIDRVTGAVLYMATALLFLIVADRPAPVPTTRRRRRRSGTPAALTMAAMAVVIPVAASPGLGHLRLDAIPFTHGGSKPGPGGTGNGPAGVAANGIGALNLIDNMRAVLTSQSETVMFTATTRTPTYWQMATLSRFDGESWTPDVATRAAAQSAPQLAPTTLPILPEPLPERTFTAHIAIDNLRSTLLPVPPGTQVINDSAFVQLEPGIGAIQPFAAPAELTYGTVAGIPPALVTSSFPTVAALDASIGPAALAPYVQLPPLPAAVVRLAHQIVGEARSPVAQANALVRYFTVGKRFRYTLNPPPVVGSDALASFLFSTRAGFCQQFAGAFAVLARADRLPTRLAVGFTTGTVTRNTYSVTGADAHSWPQIYLGPSTGWVSFEPTPATTNEPTGTGIQNGTAPTTPTNPSSIPTTTGIFNRIGPGAQPVPPASGLGSNARSTTVAPAKPAPWAAIILLALAAIAVVAAAVLAGPWLWRRRRPRLRRRRFARGHPPGAEVLARWEQASTVLARTGLARRPAETFEEHAARLVRQTRPGPVGALAAMARPGRHRATAPAADTIVIAYRDLAELAARASYSPDPLTAADVEKARRLSDALRVALRRGPPMTVGMPPRL